MPGIVFLLLAVLVLVFGSEAQAYGPIGHQIVGGIADEKLANTPAGQKVHDLLDGLPLQKAAVIPDEIKGWDKKGADDPNIFHYSSRPKLDAQLRDFWRANQPTHDMNSAAPSHHWFHYTDVPLEHLEKYKDGEEGRSKWDVVHMIAYCVDVLTGKIPEENERKITKPVAIILLAHYVGDIHQPLHVGAEYFNEKGAHVDPAKDKNALGDEGGNTFDISLANYPPNDGLNHPKKLHAFWDEETVDGLFPETPHAMKKTDRVALLEPAKEKLIHDMAAREPKNWQLPAGAELRDAGMVWADDILPLAREAHARLTMKNVHPWQQTDRVVATGMAEEKPGASESYEKWASGVVREELHKAGWRLADLLEKALSSSSSPASSPSAK